MNILSLFDGMSCGQIAINRLGIKYDNYYAAEIDKYAIQVTMDNFPNTIQLGDVRNVKASDLPKIDLIMGGSPCQSFSFAGKQKGMSTKDEQEILSLEHYLDLKSQEYEFEGQSYLFWEYMRLLNEIKPKYFLLENVVMVEKWEKILTKAIGVNPIKINSNLVSAQNRERLYWTNIGLKPNGLFGYLETTIQQPKDKKILLKDVLQDNPNAVFYLNENQTEKVLHKTGLNPIVTESSILDVYNNKIKTDGKSICLTDPCHNNLRLIEPVPVDQKYYIQLSEGQKNKFNELNVETNKSGTLTEAIGRGGSSDEYVSMLKRNAIITHTLEQMVSVRKHEVNIPKLQNLLKKHHKPAKDISEQLGIPKTKVEHWFRRDASFSIPDAFYWKELKNFLGILTDEFDAAIMEFEQREGTYEKSNRVYDEEGIAPTLTQASSDEKILVREITGGDFRHDEGFRWRENMKSGTLSTKSGNGTSKSGVPLIKEVEYVCVASRGRNVDADTTKQKIEPRNDGKTNSLTTVQKDNMVQSKKDFRIRRLTPLECERLQTVPDDYTNHVSNTQRYKMLGNGWTIDVIAHILSYANFKNE